MTAEIEWATGRDVKRKHSIFLHMHGGEAPDLNA
jgi:hypothetical protein